MNLYLMMPATLPAGFFMPHNWDIRGLILPIGPPLRIAWFICDGHTVTPFRFQRRDGLLAKHMAHFSHQLGGWYCGSSPWIYFRRNISNEAANR